MEDKKIICYRCLNIYNQKDAPKTKPKKLRGLEPECPKCGCRTYFS